MKFEVPEKIVIEIVPENELEEKIVHSELFQKASTFNTRGEGHKEKYIGLHVKQILDYIDRQKWVEERSDLRLLALLHDLGKIYVVRDENGNLLSKSHAKISADLAEEYISDGKMLDLIAIHDKYHGFYLRNLRGSFNEDKFIDVFKNVELEKLIKFNYADSNNRSKDSLIWFEDKCVDLGIRTEKLYEKQKSVLD